MMFRAIRTLAAALVLTATAASAQTVKLDMAGSLTWWGQVPVMVAIDKGFFTEQGIDTTMLSIPRLGRPHRRAHRRVGRVQQSRPHRRHRRHGARQQELLLLRQYRRLAG